MKKAFAGSFISFVTPFGVVCMLCVCVCVSACIHAWVFALCCIHKFVLDLAQNFYRMNKADDYDDVIAVSRTVPHGQHWPPAGCIAARRIHSNCCHNYTYIHVYVQAPMHVCS